MKEFEKEKEAAVLGELESTKQELESTKQELEFTKGVLGPINAKYQGYRADLEKTMSEKAALVQELNHHIAREKAFVNSLSWRITAPLRYIAKFFMK